MALRRNTLDAISTTVKVAVWLTKRLKATLINGREVEATQRSFRKEDPKAGYGSFDAHRAKSAYVCFYEEAAAIRTIECDWNRICYDVL